MHGTMQTVAQRPANISTRLAIPPPALAKVDRRHAATADQWDVDFWILNTPSSLCRGVISRAT
jgi:hypothetical protein